MKSILVLMALLGLGLLSCQNTAEETAKPVQLPKAEQFDTVLDGKKVELAWIRNSKGMKAAVTNYGARMVGLWIPMGEDSLVDVVLGLPGIREYITAEERFFGAIVGRFGNRIAKGQFTLDGKSFQLGINNPPNSLHGGRLGYHSVVWDMEQIDSSALLLRYISPDGEEGYPGQLTVEVEYRLTDANEFAIDYRVSSDQRTIANITNHNYWNLNGEGSGSINDHLLQISAERYTPVDSTLIPTGIEPVAGTPYDFRQARTIGSGLDSTHPQIRYGLGYDHNFVLDKGITTEPMSVATIKGNKSGISMEILTTEPGLQFYGGNFMKSVHTMKNGSKDDYRTAFCLETQHFPDSPNQPAFPSTVIEPGKVYTSRTVHRFLVSSE
jgi:aldose 1-epimerase